MTKTTIVLADDYIMVRQGIRVLLEAMTDFTIIGEAGDGLEAVELADRLQPDVLVTELTMPGMGGMEVIRRVCLRSPRTRIVVLSIHAAEANVQAALNAGARGYVLKKAGIDTLVHAVRTVRRGARYLCPPLYAVGIRIEADEGENATYDPYETLTPRERQVLQLTAEGHTCAEIGSMLSISPRTAEVHRSRVMHKLGLRQQIDLVRYALRRGLVSMEP